MYESGLIHKDKKIIDLNGAILSRAHLDGAILTGAHLGGAILFGTHLNNAKVTTEQLNKARSLKDATMPDGSVHP